jgi:hypothetical protein
MKKELENKFSELGGIVPCDRMSQEELLAIERDLGVSLPDDYRQLLQEYGAAGFGELVQFQPLEGVAGPLAYFYGAKTGNQSLAKQIKTFKGRMPETMIPIGDDGCGDQICLGIKAKERGKVYYWDHENEWDEEDYLEEEGKPMPPEVKFQNVNLVAESFADFIQRLEKSPYA